MIASLASQRRQNVFYIALFLYVVYALAQLDLSWARFDQGLTQGAKFITRMFPPALDKWDVLAKGLVESLQMAVLASALGIAISLPLGFLGARNLMPPWITWPIRFLVALCRAFHPVIVAILFVKAVGFGAMAGILALALATVGFTGKLFTDAIEEISMKPLEAVRATGASFLNVLTFAVLPQVLTRFVGFMTYQVDSNLRNSTMVGVVGAGGLGGTLASAFSRFDYDFVFTILATIIVIIVLGEFAANAIKKLFVDGIGRAQPQVMQIPPVWIRHSKAEKRARLLLWLAIAIALAMSIQTIDIIPEFLWDAPAQMKDMLERMWPVQWRFYPQGVHDALIETLHIASLGTLMSILMALPLGFLVAPNVTPVGWLNFLARVILVGSRSVNSLVWALLFVAIFGPGALAGTFAIAFRSVGFVGKLIGEALEEVPAGPIEALTASGGSKAAQIVMGFWPAIGPAFWSVVLLRWDINVRESSVLGLVGAGGIGMALNASIDTFAWNRVALILLCIFAIVLIAEVIVSAVRKRLL
jgi:phosphonate ABC transporter permease subunit PhnE